MVEENKKINKQEKKPEENKEKEIKDNKGTKDKKEIGEKDVKKTQEKKQDKEKEKKPKQSAFVRGASLRISSKHCFAICKMLKGKDPDQGIELLTDVVKEKKVILMPLREVAHQKGKGVAGAKYPKKACLEIIKLLNQVKANASVNEIENPVIVIAKADKASRPFRRARRKAKRTHVYIEVKDKTKLKKIKKK
jgi:ribosomal protein L22